MPRDMSGWTNREVAIAFAVLLCWIGGTLLLAWWFHKRWGTTLSIQYHFLVTRVQLLYREMRLYGMRRTLQDSNKS